MSPVAKLPTVPLSFAMELRRRRTAAGISLARLANIVHYSKSHLCKVELGSKTPSVALARSCDQALQADGALARLVHVQPVAAVISAEEMGEVWTMLMPPDGDCEFSSFNRNALPTSGTAGLKWLMPSPIGAESAADHALPTFRLWLREIQRLGQVSDPTAISKMLIPMTDTLRGLSRHGPIASRHAALRLASRFAEFTGWMAQEQGNETAALWWTGYAVNLARAGGDEELESYAFVRRAELALYRDDPMTTIELARRAQELDCAPRIRSLAVQREAQGLALAGDEKRCHNALARAADLMELASSATDPELMLGSTNITNPMPFATGWCLQDLGRPAEAAAILANELNLLRPDAHRVRARYGARLALSLASEREIERACFALEQVLDVASLINSATVRHDLRQVTHMLGRWRSNPAVRMIMPRLTAALRVSNA